MALLLEAGEDGSPIHGPMCIVGPEAWMEGQRQKGWTLATIIMLLLVAREKNTQGSLLGQGDIQMAIINAPSGEELANQKLELLKRSTSTRSQ